MRGVSYIQKPLRGLWKIAAGFSEIPHDAILGYLPNDIWGILLAHFGKSQWTVLGEFPKTALREIPNGV